MSEVATKSFYVNEKNSHRYAVVAEKDGIVTLKNGYDKTFQEPVEKLEKNGYKLVQE